MAGELDDKDHFHDPGEPPELTAEEMAKIQPYLDRPKRRPSRVSDPIDRYPHAIKGTKKFDTTNNKNIVTIQCQVPNCPNTRDIFVSDLFQVDTCLEHRPLIRKYKRRMQWEKMQQMNTGAEDLLWGEDTRSVSEPLVEELGGIRPAHILVKAKHDSSWIEYADDEGNLKYMQVHDVRSARDSFGRWVVYGVDQDGKPAQELYDLRHDSEHSHTFNGVRELEFGEIVKLAKRGVIKSVDGQPIQSLADLMKIADEPLRKLILKKAKEAKAGGPSLAEIDKQLFGDKKSSVQRRTGKAGTRPWTSTSS